MKATLAALVMGVLAVVTGAVQAQPLNDPAIHGMQTLPVVEGCNVPGGLRPITSSDGPNDAMFWCGVPPYCLEQVVGSPERCHIIPGSRNGGTTGVRDPLDLRCDLSGVHPTGGRCPVPPTLSATVNNVQHASLNQGTGVTLRVNTASALPLSTPTVLTMACSGTNAGVSPFNQTNLIGIAGQNYTYPVATAVNAGATNCTITATNPAGTVNYAISFNAAAVVASPPPTIEVVFNPRNPTVNTSVQVRTRTTNATSLTWTCSGRWTNRNTARAVGGWISSNHSVSGSPGTANCTFTAVGPGGSRSANASWTSVASGGGSGGGNDSQLPQSLPPLSFVITYSCADIAFSRHLLARADYNSNGTVTVRSEPPTYVRTTTAMTYNWGTRAVSGGVAAIGGQANVRINVTSTHMTAAGGSYNRFSEMCSSNP
jgi:hypothetical protein